MTAAPATTVPAGSSGGQAVANSVVSVTLISGWSKDSSSTSTSLALVGPDGLSAVFSTQQVSPSDTLSDIFDKQISNFESDSNFQDVSVCSEPQSGGVPGTPAISGGGAEICFTGSTQSGGAQLWAALVFDGLVPGSAGGNQLLVTELAFTPQSNSEAVVGQELKPVLQSARWLQVSSS